MPYEGDLATFTDEQIIAHAFYPVIDTEYAGADKDEFIYYVAVGARLTIVGIALDDRGRYGSLVRHEVEASIPTAQAVPARCERISPVSNMQNQ